MTDEEIIFVNVNELVSDRVNDTRRVVTLDRVNDCVIRLTRVNIV